MVSRSEFVVMNGISYGGIPPEICMSDDRDRSFSSPRAMTAPVAKRSPQQEAALLGLLIHDVARLRSSAYDQWIKPLSISRAQCGVLARMVDHDGLTQTQLADRLVVGKASLGAVLERLEARGWVQRQADPGDQRLRRVFLTDAGRLLINDMTALERAFNRKALARLSADERAITVRALQKMKSSIARMDAEQMAAILPL